MKVTATLNIHIPPAANETADTAVPRVEAIAEKIRKAIGADKYVVRAGAGFIWEITFS